MQQLPRQMAFSLIYLILYFISGNDAQPEGFVDYPTSVSNILSLMSEYGLQKIKSEGRGNTQQYLVATMVTADELDEAAVWEMDNILALGTDRLKIYFNKKVDEPDKTETQGGPRHGEIIFMYFDGHESVDIFKKSLPATRETGVHGKPYLILYSYYIPCACIPYCSFNCAEELGKFAHLHSEDINTIVGYSAVYSATDKDNSEVFMKEGGVLLFRDMAGNYKNFIAVQVITDDNSKPMKETFQENLRQCLIESPASSCVTDDDAKERIVTAFINYLMLPYFTNSYVPNFFGKLSKMYKFYLQKEIKSKLERSIRKVSCDKMPLDPESCRLLIKSCIESALDQTDRLAYPTFGSTRHDKPIEDSMRWRDAEAESRNFYYFENYVEVPDCDKRFNSVTSLCISKAEKKVKKGKNELPDMTGHELNNEELGRLRGASGTSTKTGHFSKNEGPSKSNNL